ncbi:MAG: hypothetical protein FJW32_03565 [Acidobacteria bacterium]|nr:hypothetical protein [Acidobacteriota bacterium]
MVRFTAVLFSITLWAQTELRFKFDPAPRVRPGETVSVQVQVWNEVTAADGTKSKVRQREVATIKAAPGQGAVSKPYRFQGADDGGFAQTGNSVASIFQNAAGKFTDKDAALYTAPMQPGRYTIEAEKGQVRATAEIEVAADAPSRRIAEKQDFAKEPDNNRYRRLAEHWAPFIAQESWWQPKADIPTRFDFDGDWAGDNNWDNADTGTSQAYVYYAAVETSTHWFVHYNFFHPRDYSDNCVVGTCHENDNEGIILTVRKDGSEFGRLEVMETLAHNNVYSFTNESKLRKGAHNIDGKIDLHDGHHPMVFIEAGGHGALSTTSDHSTYSASTRDFKTGTGMTFFYRGAADRAKHGDDRLIGYDLISIEDAWWARTKQNGGKTFDAEYVYQPFGGRPGAGTRYVGSFLGRKHGANKAKPFWGWHDERTRRGKVLNTGQWALDPAYAVTKNLTWPADLPVDLNYTYNPYLGVAAEPVAPTQPIEKPAVTEGGCQLEASIDGSVVISVRQAAAQYEVLNGQAEKDASIGCNGELPVAPVRVFEARKTRGRGTVSVVERPSEANNFTAKIRVDDSSRGADRYIIAIRWGL